MYHLQLEVTLETNLPSFCRNVSGQCNLYRRRIRSKFWGATMGQVTGSSSVSYVQKRIVLSMLLPKYMCLF